MDRNDLARWLDAYGEAWQNFDADAAVALFSPEATYQEQPFDEPMRGRGEIHLYWLEAAQAQREVKFDYHILSVEPAVVHWQAGYIRARDAEETRLDGILLLEFDDGLCTSLREWWHAYPSPAF